jgi:hypothetical protein
MRAHVIEDSIVVNTIVVDRMEDWPEMNLVDASYGGSIGDMFLGFDEAGVPLFAAPALE